jgi:MFS family permease
MITHFSAVTIERVSPEARGRALGLINSSISLGQMLIPLVTEPLRVALGIQPMFGVLAAAVFIAGVATLVAPRLRPGPAALIPAGAHGKPPGGRE